MACLAFCLDWTCDWVSQLVVFNTNPLYIDSVIFPCWPELISSSLATQSNQFMSRNLIELSIIPYYLLLLIIYFPKSSQRSWFLILYFFNPSTFISYISLSTSRGSSNKLHEGYERTKKREHARDSGTWIFSILW